MKITKIITPIVKEELTKGTKEVHRLGESSMKEFNNVSGDIAGRTKVLLDSAKEITNEQLKKVKTELEQKMIDRGFSQNNIKYILSYTNKDNYQVVQAFVDDMYAHTSKMMWAIPYTTKETAPLMRDAVLKKNYEAIYDIRSGKIKDFSQIEDLREKVISEGRIYEPAKKTVLAINQDKLAADKKEILEKIRALGVDFKGYEYSINSESIEVAKVLTEDKNVDKKMIRWILPYTNSENAELMLRAVLNKDYNAVYSIQSGDTRLFETLEARYAAMKRLSKATTQEEKSKLDFYLSCGDKSENPVINDRNSKVLKLLFEDSEFNMDIIDKIFKHINKENVNILEKALKEKDFATIEKIIGEKFNSRDVGFVRKSTESEFKTTSPTGKITRNDFIKYMEEKLKNTEHLDTNTLKDSEIRNLAKLFGTTEEQIKNMDKKEYRRLCIKTHPDRNQDDSMANQVFRILNKLFIG